MMDVTRPWDGLSDDEKKLFARMAEVYAGFSPHTDNQIGRLLEYLEESGQIESTVIVVVSDNGASGEGSPNGSINENKFFNGVPDDLKENLRMIDKLGARHLQPLPQRLGDGVQHAVQDVEALRVQRRHVDPCIVAWPKGKGQGRGARSVPPCDRHRANDARFLGVGPRRRSRATTVKHRRREHALYIRRARPSSAR